MTGLWFGIGVVALLVLLFAGDWLLAGRTRKRRDVRHLCRQTEGAVSRRDDARSMSQNNATRNGLSGSGGTSGP